MSVRPKTCFTEKVGETYTNDDGIGIPFEDFTVSDFREQLFRKQRVKDIVQNSENMNLLKVELDLMELKRQETVKTVEDIIKFVLKGSTPLAPNTDTSQFNLHNMPLKDRDLSIIAKIVRGNVMNNSRALQPLSTYDKSDFNILVCRGAPGIGKTRLGKELFNNIQANKERITKKHFDHFQSKLLSGKEKRQKATLVPIKCPMLTTKSMFQIVDFYAEKCGAEKTDDDTCFNKLNKNGKAFFHNIKDQDFDKIFKETTITLEEYKSFVTPDECLDPNDEIRTIESLETTRIILKESDQPFHFNIKMPFFFVIFYNNILRITPIELGETFNVNYSMRWELFVAHYEAFISNMLIVCENKSEATLKELYRGAHRKYVTLNKTVKLKHLNVRQSLKHARQVGLRWKELTKLEDIKECIKNLLKKSESIINSYPDPCCITILVTTRRCNFDYEQLPEDVLVIDQTNFKEYFGHIFSPHAAFYLAEDINPNFSELTKIENIVNNVGVVTADKIIEERPYYNLEDFLEKHKHNKRQKLEES
ncbi:hypothetical protein RhiirA4_472922 [Rhizophagus irregularis]|uniref:Crinkler family protein n=1 Tax=Rhizophagus irregularis TaxID=588596 RepID=A0A2I1H5T3_9GLOM|nr:hypothetical protein RhiirA4_472922 [Rhizophagus irregularis]